MSNIVTPFDMRAGCTRAAGHQYTGPYVTSSREVREPLAVPENIHMLRPGKTLEQAAYERRHAEAVRAARFACGPNAAPAQLCEHVRLTLNRVYDDIRIKELRKVSLKRTFHYVSWVYVV